MKFSQLYRKQLRTVFSGNKYTPDSLKESIAKSIVYTEQDGSKHTLHDAIEARAKFMQAVEAAQAKPVGE